MKKTAHHTYLDENDNQTSASADSENSAVAMTDALAALEEADNSVKPKKRKPRAPRSRKTKVVETLVQEEAAEQETVQEKTAAAEAKAEAPENTAAETASQSAPSQASVQASVQTSFTEQTPEIEAPSGDSRPQSKGFMDRLKGLGAGAASFLNKKKQHKAKDGSAAAQGENARADGVKPGKFNFNYQEFREQYLNKEYLKGFIHDKSRMTMLMAGGALFFSVIAVCRSGDSNIDPSNAFVQSNMRQNAEAQSFASANSKRTSTGIIPGQPDNALDLDPNNQQPKGMVIRDKAEFKVLVRDTLAELRLDKARERMAERAAKYNAADEAVPAGRKIYGNPKARFIIQEFSDVECPYCKNFFAVPKEVADLSNGQVAVEWKNLPLQFHDPAATQEAIAIQCVYRLGGNKKFWMGLDRLFEATQSNGRGVGALVHELSDELDISAEKYLSCMNEPDTVKAVNTDKEDAAGYGIQSTPCSVIVDTLTGKTRTISGAVPKEELMQAIEAMNDESQKEAQNSKKDSKKK